MLSFGWRSDGENKCDPFDFEVKRISCYVITRARAALRRLSWNAAAVRGLPGGQGRVTCPMGVHPRLLQDGKTCSCGQKLKEQCLPGKGTPSCAKTSVNCIEGTGDFRIAIWDTHLGTASPPKNNFCPEGNPLHTCMDAIGKCLSATSVCYQ